MSIGANIAVIAAGAVLAFAVRVHTEGVSVQTVGAVLMVVGAIGLVLQIRALLRQRELTSVQARTPAQAVLVRPDGSAQPPSPGATPDAYPGEYPGNGW